MSRVVGSYMPRFRQLGLALVLMLVAMGVSTPCWAVPPGTVVFETWAPPTVDARALDADGITPLEGSYVGQLFVGQNPQSLRPVGAVVKVMQGQEAGRFSGGSLVLPGIGRGETVLVQLRVWDSASGEDWETALAAGGKTGASDVLALVSGGLPPQGPPCFLRGMRDFRVTSRVDESTPSSQGPSREPLESADGAGREDAKEPTAAAPQDAQAHEAAAEILPTSPSTPVAVPQPGQDIVLYYPKGGSPLETFAAKEVRRYFYLRTGRLIPMQPVTSLPSNPANAFVLGRKDRAFMREAASRYSLGGLLGGLGPDSFRLRTVSSQGRPVVLICGGDDVGVLYAAYRFAEAMGVRFGLHGDTIPDGRLPATLPVVDAGGKPLFAVRGIIPFHGLPEGPDWWDTDGYLAVIGQMAKLRLNLIGLHAYPEYLPYSEPSVWIGLTNDIGPGKKVRFSVPSAFYSTLERKVGLTPKRTSDFSFGASQMFDVDDYCSPVNAGLLRGWPIPLDLDNSNLTFERTAEMFDAAFSEGRRLGVKSAIGSETPLTIPWEIGLRIQDQGRDWHAPGVPAEVYEGIFRRAYQAHALDYYFLWTKEDWTWVGVSEDDLQATVTDVFSAITGLNRSKAPIKLAMCGWVAGPAQNPRIFDDLLPKSIPVSSLGRSVGRSTVDRAYGEMQGRSRWAVSWLEDDGSITTPPLWVGRVRRDAAEALHYGCNGFLGIHWRTRIINPSLVALSEACWDQRDWTSPPFELSHGVDGPFGGLVADFPANTITGTTEPRIYQSVRYGFPGYQFRVPNGSYTVTLKFCEPAYEAAGRRVFDVLLQYRRVIQRLDIFANAGRNKALDFTFTNTEVHNGLLDISFQSFAEFPAIAGIVIQGPGFSRRIDCGGEGGQGYESDTGPGVAVQPSPLAPSSDFFTDWASAEFGPEAGYEAANIFRDIDCRIPRTSDWLDGPGAIWADTRPLSDSEREYAFVERFKALRGKARTKGAQERLEYWIHTFEYQRAMEDVRLALAAQEGALDAFRDTEDDDVRRQIGAERLLPALRITAARLAGVYEHLLATVSTVGEMGTVVNWETHILPEILTKPVRELTEALGSKPEGLDLPSSYRGPTRIILPSVRTALKHGEPFHLKVVLLSEKTPAEVSLYWRHIGESKFTKTPAKHVARGVYSCDLPAAGPLGQDFEYYIKTLSPQGESTVAPPTAPNLNNTVVITPW